MKYNYVLLIAFLMLFITPQTLVTADPENKTNEEAEASKDDVVVGKEGDDSINTGDGNDNIAGKGGDDFIEAGEGDDLISGGAGDDKILGGPGDDYIIGGDGNDIVDDGAGNDFINLGDGNDTFVYNVKNNLEFTDYAVGGEGEDTLVIVKEDIDELMKNEIIKYYEKQKMVGADIVHMGKFDISLGVSQFEHVVVATSFSF